ncbi:MAG: phosphatase PAP2 family protein [candidate division Zixibacteria bacterium]|nr:phosphatase PAP2 family protein [candidate division Zixibacteria bacterium]
MLEYLNTIDRTLFEFINIQLANSVTDFIMPIITSDNLLRVLYGFAMVLILIYGNRRLRWLVLFSVVALTLTDQISSQFLKNLIERPRPCHILEEINLLVGCGGGFAMPSSHAANAFGQACLFSMCIKELKYYIYAFASLIAVSRIFVGVHYPGDIIVGAVVGCLIGFLLAVTFGIFEKRHPQRI